MYVLGPFSRENNHVYGSFSERMKSGVYIVAFNLFHYGDTAMQSKSMFPARIAPFSVFSLFFFGEGGGGGGGGENGSGSGTEKGAIRAGFLCIAI